MESKLEPHDHFYESGQKELKSVQNYNPYIVAILHKYVQNLHKTYSSFKRKI